MKNLRLTPSPVAVDAPTAPSVELLGADVCKEPREAEVSARACRKLKRSASCRHKVIPSNHRATPWWLSDACSARRLLILPAVRALAEIPLGYHPPSPRGVSLRGKPKVAHSRLVG